MILLHISFCYNFRHILKNIFNVYLQKFKQVWMISKYVVKVNILNKFSSVHNHIWILVSETYTENFVFYNVQYLIFTVFNIRLYNSRYLTKFTLINI